ncbi:hypothetical protein PR003_g21981 [Phytophthora rubi]|uniref:Major facilitator superfamily (MFS) profile domain-containing protein n=1 Tax=Phytophthora rubi TaxID=129364 RepID=A0A6A4D8P5_9STRA|nr:hypothetical protein PR003_g21981 [Phytophthora rubi]
MSTIRRRLDSLEAYPSWFFVRLLLLSGFSWSLNAAEYALYTLARRRVSKSVHMTTVAVESLGGGLFIGAVVGAPLFGHIAGIKGRRWALLLAKTLSLLGLVLSVMARRDVELISARILAGIGFGGELPVVTVLVHELTPKSMRSRVVALLHTFTGVGGIVGVALALMLEPRFGWRAAYLVLSGSIFCVGVLFYLLPESPRWLASSGRMPEAIQEVETLERAHRTRMIYDRAMVHDVSSLVTEDLETSVEIVKPSGHDSTVRLWTMWIVMELSGYALGVYVPVLISLWGFNMFSRWTTMVLLCFAQVAGSVLASMMLEEVGLKKLLFRCAASAALIVVILTHSPSNGPAVVIGTCAVSALLAASWSCVLVYAPANFSTEARGRGVGYAFGFSRLGAVIGAWLYPRMFNVWRMSVPAVAWVFAVLLVMVVLWVGLPVEHSNMAPKVGGLPDDDKTGSKIKLLIDERESPALLGRSHNKNE